MDLTQSIARLQEHLTAQHLDDYIAALESIPGKAGVINEFVLQQDRNWTAAMLDLGVKSENVAEIIAAISGQTRQLNSATNELFNNIEVGTIDGWKKLVSILQKELDNDITSGYFIKEAVLKKFLLDYPPINIITHLGYQSIEACLKSEAVFEIMAALRFSESEEWMEGYLQQYHQLSADSFEERAVSFLMLDPQKWWKLAEPFALKKKHHFSHLKEVGVVFSYPAPDQVNNSSYLHILIMMILHYIYEVKFYSNFFQQNINRFDDFGSIFIEILSGDQNICATDVKHLPIIQQYHLKKPQPNPCVFEPHVMPEVLHWHKARLTFFSMLENHPQYELFSFWNSCYNVGKVIAGNLISLNFPDNILSQDTPLVYHYKEDLWNSLFNIYFSEPILEDAVVDAFAKKVINLSELIQTHYGQGK